MDRMVRRPEALAVLRPQSNPPAAEVFFNTKVSVQFARRSGHECSAAPAHPAICDRCAAEGQEEATRTGAGVHHARILWGAQAVWASQWSAHPVGKPSYVSGRMRLEVAAPPLAVTSNGEWSQSPVLAPTAHKV